jgi:hypothetical protein
MLLKPMNRISQNCVQAESHCKLPHSNKFPSPATKAQQGGRINFRGGNVRNVQLIFKPTDLWKTLKSYGLTLNLIPRSRHHEKLTDAHIVIPCLVWYSKVQCNIHKIPPLVRILSHIKPVYNFISYFLNCPQICEPCFIRNDLIAIFISWHCFAFWWR